MPTGYGCGNALNVARPIVPGAFTARLLRMSRWILALFAALCAVVPPAAGQSIAPLGEQVAAALNTAAAGTRFGLVVTDQDGRELVAINPDQRFIPASNTKMFTTAAAFWSLKGIDQPDVAGGASVRIEDSRGQRDVVLTGAGDARLSSAPACLLNCLATLADAIAAKTRVVHDVIGDDSLYPDQRWSPGMSWNNIPTRSGTATSALTLDDNELAMTVTPAAVGQPPMVALPTYFTIANRAITVASGPTTIDFDRAPNGTEVRVTGTIASGAKLEELRLGIDDPAHYAAWMLRNMLQARGVRVTGVVSTRHRPFGPGDDHANRGGNPYAAPPATEALARLVPPPLIEDLTRINKISQNLHAELMLRRIGRQTGSGSIADGQAVVRAMLSAAGVERTAFDFSDGSGMSTYNRVTPRGMIVFLRWVSRQPWGAAWRATLPIGGEGTLTRRFAGTALAGKLFAKTGTLNATNALSGYMTGKSGAALTFSIFANDVPDGESAIRAMDQALLLVASAN